MAGREQAVFAERDRKREAAPDRRSAARAASRPALISAGSLSERFGGTTMEDGLGGG